MNERQDIWVLIDRYADALEEFMRGNAIHLARQLRENVEAAKAEVVAALAKRAASVQQGIGSDAALVKEQVEQYRKGYRHGYEEGKAEAVIQPTPEVASVQPDIGSDAALVKALQDIAEACNCCGDRHDLAQIAQDALDGIAAVPAQPDIEQWRSAIQTCLDSSQGESEYWKQALASFNAHFQ